MINNDLHKTTGTKPAFQPKMTEMGYLSPTLTSPDV
jgi:hypothetical protein